MVHYRKDNPRGITSINPDAPKDKIEHITKHRGQKTPYTSVSEDKDAIRHFEGVLYRTDSDDIELAGHLFISHSNLIEDIRKEMHQSRRERRVLATRALQLATHAREAIVEWQFNLPSVQPKDRVTWCRTRINTYFTHC